MCVKGEESVGSPGAEEGKSLPLWGSGLGLVAGKRSIFLVCLAYSSFWERGGPRLPGIALLAGLGGGV